MACVACLGFRWHTGDSGGTPEMKMPSILIELVRRHTVFLLTLAPQGVLTLQAEALKRNPRVTPGSFVGRLGKILTIPRLSRAQQAHCTGSRDPSIIQ